MENYEGELLVLECILWWDYNDVSVSAWWERVLRESISKGLVSELGALILIIQLTVGIIIHTLAYNGSVDGREQR